MSTEVCHSLPPFLIPISFFPCNYLPLPYLLPLFLVRPAMPFPSMLREQQWSRSEGSMGSLFLRLQEEEKAEVARNVERYKDKGVLAGQGLGRGRTGEWAQRGKGRRWSRAGEE